MLANINVDYERLEGTASMVSTYVRVHKANMANATNDMMSLFDTWQGEDANQFRMKWSQVNTKDSISQSMLVSMENYANFLRYAANHYKSAQVNAINLAQRISENILVVS